MHHEYLEVSVNNLSSNASAVLTHQRFPKNSYHGLADSHLFSFLSAYLSHSSRLLWKSNHCSPNICGLTFHSTSVSQVTCDVCENSFRAFIHLWNGGLSKGSNWLYVIKYHAAVLFWLEKWRAYFKGTILYFDTVLRFCIRDYCVSFTLQFR